MTMLDGQRYVVDHGDLAVSLGQIPQLDGRHALPPLNRRFARLYHLHSMYEHRSSFSLHSRRGL
jgi:hypothetical protein